MARSLRWRLQIWYAVVLVLAIAGFGSILFFEVRKARMDEIDAELVAGARTLEGVLRNAPPEFWSGRATHLDRALRLPPAPVRWPEQQPSPAYFVIRLESGTILKASHLLDPEPPPTDARPGEIVRRNRGLLHEVAIIGPNRTQILVGRSIERELGGMHRFAWRLLAITLGVCGIGLAGGWWLAGRAVRPIEEMSRTASGITASNLSARLDLADVDLELGRLGSILNDMLGRIEDAFARQVRFTADASHELRTPLSVILAHAELALNRPRSAEEYREAIETTLKAARRMQSLVGDLLLLARADAGELALRPVRCDLLAIAEETAALLEPIAAQREVVISVKGEPVDVMADRERMSQVITNLIANAILYNRPRGTITLAIYRDGDLGDLSLADSGKGISEADLPHIFDRFYRADRSRTREAGTGSAGSGLGLAICKSIVEAHGGTIACSSELGVGTTFVVRLRRGLEI